MASSGIRIGALDYLKWKHIIPITENNKILAAKIIVYGGDSEQYYSFITPEAYKSLKDWLDFRASYGEKISGESWVFRDLWQTTNITYGANLGLATCPRKLKSSGIKRILERALWEQGFFWTLVCKWEKPTNTFLNSSSPGHATEWVICLSLVCFQR